MYMFIYYQSRLPFVLIDCERSFHVSDPSISTVLSVGTADHTRFLTLFKEPPLFLTEFGCFYTEKNITTS